MFGKDAAEGCRPDLGQSREAAGRNGKKGCKGDRMTEQQKNYNFNISRLKAIPKGERYHDPFCMGFEGEIDEMIYPTIETLNKKGYYTSYSCSGHYKRNEKIHIMFDPEVKAEHFATIPAGFEIETVQHGEMRELTQEEIEAGYTMQLDTVFSVIISKQIPAGNEYQRFRETLLTNATLLQWATELPDRAAN